MLRQPHDSVMPPHSNRCRRGGWPFYMAEAGFAATLNNACFHG